MSSAIAAGQYGSSRTGSISAKRAWIALRQSLVFRPRLADRCAIPSFDRLRPRRLWPLSRLKPRLPPELCNPHFSSAAPRPCAPSCWRAPQRRACAACAQASDPTRSRQQRRGKMRGALLSSRLIVRSPIFEMPPSRCFPPVECWRGVSPIQAAKLRPFRNVSIGGASATMAVAAMGPMPGMVISRRTASFSFALRAISRSSMATRTGSSRRT